MDTALDHIVIAAPDLELAKRTFFDATGVMPTDGGPHPGGGTRNALVAFAGDHYLELITPDPDQDRAGTLGERLESLDAPVLLHFALRATGLAGIAREFDELGITHAEPRRMTRKLPAGGELEWELMGVGGHDQGGVVPFFIDWLECVHPSDTSETVGPLLDFTVTAPAGSVAARVLESAPRHVRLAEGSEALALEFDSPNGKVRFEAAAPMGFSFG